MPKRSCLAIVLAAGDGTRMKSAKPKVLHEIGGLPMLGHVLKTASASGADRIVVVARKGAGGDAVAAAASKMGAAAVYRQDVDNPKQKGTAKAVLAAAAEFAGGFDDILVLYGDTPMVTTATLKALRKAISGGAAVAVLGFKPADPRRYGRLILDGKQLVAIREFKEASDAEKAIGFCNAGLMGFAGSSLGALLKRIGNKNQSGEHYLTEVVALANRDKQKVVALTADADEVAGADDRQQLAHVEGLFQRRMREAAMAAGVTMIAPSTVWFSHDTRLGRDVTIEPNVFFGPEVTIADNVMIRANCHIAGARIASGATIGPFARLRPSTDIGPNVHIGDFVEVKNARLGDGAKANHLAYIGDADVGAGTNIGAGTITANYDGFDKYRTVIGANVSIGSNAVLRAPVTIGDGASVAAGSVINRDVEPDALAVARGQQVNKPDWARKFREKKRGSGNRTERKSR